MYNLNISCIPITHCDTLHASARMDIHTHISVIV